MSYPNSFGFYFFSFTLTFQARLHWLQKLRWNFSTITYLASNGSFSFLAKFNRKLWVIRAEQSCQWFRTLSLRFFWPGVFCCLRLGVCFCRDSVNWLVILMAALISIMILIKACILALTSSLEVFLSKALPSSNSRLSLSIHSLINSLRLL